MKRAVDQQAAAVEKLRGYLKRGLATRDLVSVQERALQVGTHYPLGEWYSASAVSARTKGWIRPPSTIAFWNVEIAKR